MIRRAFIQELGGGRMEPEMRDVLGGLQERGIPAELFTAKRLERRQLPLDRETLVAGDVPSVLGALGQLGLEPPPTNDYPRSLEPFLHRRLWTSTVRRLVAGIEDGSSPPVFAKPQGRKKRFTGHVFGTQEDLLYLQRTSLSTPILCSEVVRWRSEYRVFVIRGRIVGVRHYAGDPAIPVDEAQVERAVRSLEEAGEGTAAYGVDFGVLETGQTALIEWNDGFALGSYGLDRSLYTELTLTRWEELTGGTPSR
ncbi:ATP-grasp domain-containing protein [Archangium lansingense]|uniref:ATP-grasp domain-containing protein n=1 Tax=Archangium lansingense TaxID=2995310 RepID=UPI003B7B3796